MVKSIAVVGAGIIGLSVATHILEELSHNVKVTVLADKISPDTAASDRSGGLIVVPDTTNLSEHESLRIKKWFDGSLKRFNELFNSEDGGSIGLTILHGYSTNLNLAKLLDSSRITDGSEVKTFAVNPNISLLCFSTFIVSCRTYLPWMMDRIKSLGGSIHQQKINKLSDLMMSYDIIVNCAGVGAGELCSDQDFSPMRGHVVSVHAPWIKQFYIDKTDSDPEGTYILPQVNNVILGGTYESNADDTTVDPATIQRLLNRCQQVVPSLKRAEVLDSWVGVRPIRKGGVRLEVEMLSVPVVHCYGHGRHGVSLSWGTALEVGELIRKIL
jgi:glycine/D-amino acid oxidase-like deaminating enzyme